MSDIEIIPLGHYVKVEVLTVENKTKSGLIISTGETSKWEQDANEFGVIRSFGNLAFHGITGCNPNEYPTNDPRFRMSPNQIWGVDIGDQVEFKRYEGKKTSVKQAGNVRYIPDTCIVGKIVGNLEIDGSQI